MTTSWWSSAAAQELRAAYYDTRRAPGWVVLGMIAVFWPLTGFSVLPVAVAAGAWVVMMLITRPIRRWFLRRRIRRAARPLIGLLALLVLTIKAGPWAWVLAAGVWLLIAAMTDTVRAHSRLADWIIGAVARTARADPVEFELSAAEWDGRRLLYAEIQYGPMVRTEDAASRNRIADAVAWSLRDAGRYTVSWPAGMSAFEVRATPTLPSSVDEQDWADDLPGIPIGVTDEETADGIVETTDAETGTVIQSLPIALVNPANAQKHYLVVGGTGAGKSVWMRGFIARGIRLGWWPGGVFIFDGKGGSDYIVFEGRENIHCVARHPEEWSEWLPRVSGMMRQRYDEDAEYERGNQPRPDFPRYLVVLDEVQEIRTVLGKDELDPILQQLSRQMRASNGRLMLSTQRPDANDAIPGAVRDMLEERIILGFVSATGARMVLDDDWREVVDEYGSNTVPGRGLARVGGRLLRIQGFNLQNPRRHPEAERFYPPKASTTPTQQGEATISRSAQQWAPRQPSADTASDPDDTTHEQEPREAPPPPDASQVAQHPDPPAATRRRRRTV